MCYLTAAFRSPFFLAIFCHNHWLYFLRKKKPDKGPASTKVTSSCELHHPVGNGETRLNYAVGHNLEAIQLGLYR